MSQKRDYADGYFNDIIDHLIHAECRSWEERFSVKIWGLHYHEKVAVEEIRFVRQNRITGTPTFNIFFKDSKNICNTLNLDYVLKYSEDIPLLYEELKV
jgi:hypothetical protein